MSDNIEKTTIESNNLILDEDRFLIEDNTIDYSKSELLINFVKNKFKRLSFSNASNLLQLLLNKKIIINVKEFIKKPKGFIQYNLGKLNNDEIKTEVILELIEEIDEIKIKLGKNIIYDENIDDEVFKLNKNILYQKIRKHICDEGGNVKYKYNFKSPDMEVKFNPENLQTLQLCQVQIMGNAIKFEYPIEFGYVCPECGTITMKKAYETVSTFNKINCPGIIISGEKTKRCNKLLSPDSESGITKDSFFFSIGYEDEKGNKYTADAITFELFSPGFYNVVLFRIRNPKKGEYFLILDVEKLENTINFKLPENKEDENYFFTLQRYFDRFIFEQTNVELFGLFPVKVALIIQALNNFLENKLIMNMQIVGDPSTGKSIIIKYYSFLLNNELNLSTNGLSISIPGLRGTRASIVLMGKEIKIVTRGYLGSYKSIHIDEAGESPELIQNLKTFLLEDNYSYDKAGANGLFYKRTAQLNLSENINNEHIGQYRGAIRKAYKEMNIVIDGMEKPEWNENWDLYLPLFMYNSLDIYKNNLYLFKVIKDKRSEHTQKNIWWIDGYDIALHDRFPFYFYLVNNGDCTELKLVIKGNVARDIISENYNLMKALKTDVLNNFFKELLQYKNGDDDVKAFERVDEILNEYGIETDSRKNTFYYSLVKLSRIINKRKVVNEIDYNLLKWYLEKINTKLNINETTNYELKGAPNNSSIKEKELEIEDKTKKVEDLFSTPNWDEFEGIK